MNTDGVVQNVPFSELTTIQIGGPISYYVETESPEEFTQLVQFSRKKSVPFFVIGSGSNLLVADEGFKGVVIRNTNQSIETVGEEIVVGAGTVLQDYIDWANEQGYAGFEKMAGIPGTVGGAVYGNAGAYGQTISDNLEWVEILNPTTLTVDRLTSYECEFSYRESRFKKSTAPVGKEIILRVGFVTQREDPAKLAEISSEIITMREQKYHHGIKCPGSFFKNIEAHTLSGEVLAEIPDDKIMYGKIPAGWLLEAVGAKGDRENGIEIAPWHGNLFMNTGNGNATAFVKLAKKYWLKVKEKFGIILEPEVQLIGFSENPFQ